MPVPAFLRFQLLVAAIFLGLFASTALAQGPQHISLVLIIDNSGSMLGTDPLDLRLAAASQLVDLLESGDEISIVLFSDDSSVLVPLTKVTDEASKAPVRAKLATVFASGNTNMRAGLQSGLAELDRATNPVRFAIFLTDGQLYPPGWPGFTPEQQEAERQAVFGLASQYGAKKWGLFPVSLSTAVEPEFLERLAKEGGGLYREAPEAADLSLVFQEIFAAKKLDVFEILFSDCLAPGEKQKVDFPVHQFVSTLELFVTYPGEPRPAVTVAGPGGAPVAPTASEPQYDSYSVNKPPRGTWTVTVTGAASGESCVAISSTPRALVDLGLLSPTETVSLGEGEPLELTVEVVATDPQSGKKTPVEGATVKATVTGPDGKKYEAALTHTSGGEYAGSVPVNGVEGKYAIELVASTSEGEVARQNFAVTVAAAAPQVTPPPTATATPPPAAAGGGGGGGMSPALLLLLPVALVVAGGSYAGYCRFGRPQLHGYLQAPQTDRAYDLEARHRRTVWRRALTLGGPADDIDLGLGRRWARVVPRRNGECYLQAIEAGGVVVDSHPLRQGKKRRIYHRSELNIGGIALVYRALAGGPRERY